MASLEYFWEDIPLPKYPRHHNTFTNGYIKVVHPDGGSIRLTVPFLNSVALNENELKYTNVASSYYRKFWMLGRLLEMQERNCLAKDLVYSRLQFGFGHTTIAAAGVERVAESEEDPVEKEMRETEAAPISETATTLKAPFLMPNYHEMNFQTYTEVIPVVIFMGDDYKVARQLFGNGNEMGREDNLGWLVSPGFVWGEPYAGVEYENRPHAGPSFRKRDWIAGWDREQREYLFSTASFTPFPSPISSFESFSQTRKKNLIFWLRRRDLVNGHKLHFLKPTFGRANVFDYM